MRRPDDQENAATAIGRAGGISEKAADSGEAMALPPGPTADATASQRWRPRSPRATPRCAPARAWMRWRQYPALTKTCATTSPSDSDSARRFRLVTHGDTLIRQGELA
jgi:hypothetical protein